MAFLTSGGLGTAGILRAFVQIIKSIKVLITDLSLKTSKACSMHNFGVLHIMIRVKVIGRSCASE